MYTLTAVHRIHGTEKAVSVRFNAAGYPVIEKLFDKPTSVGSAMSLGWMIPGLNDLHDPTEGVPGNHEWVHLEMVGLTGRYVSRDHRWQVSRKIERTGNCRCRLVHGRDPNVWVEIVIPYGMGATYYMPPNAVRLGIVIVNLTGRNAGSDDLSMIPNGNYLPSPKPTTEQ